MCINTIVTFLNTSIMLVFSLTLRYKISPGLMKLILAKGIIVILSEQELQCTYCVGWNPPDGQTKIVSLNNLT